MSFFRVYFREKGPEQFHSVNGAEIFNENMKTAHVAWLGTILVFKYFSLH